jgi:hypothetical protein
MGIFSLKTILKKLYFALERESGAVSIYFRTKCPRKLDMNCPKNSWKNLPKSSSWTLLSKKNWTYLVESS